MMLGVLILAGGKGNRIGGNKPLVKLGGRILISYVLEVANKISNDVIVVLGNNDDLQSMRKKLPWEVKIIKDIGKIGGPLIGVYTGFKQLSMEYAAVLPCDSPFINIGVLKFMESEVKGMDAAIPIWPNGYIEPLHGIYRVPTALDASHEALKENKTRIYNMIEKLKNKSYIPIEKLKKFDPDLLSFFNINNTNDLKQAEAILSLRAKMDSKK
jgi:molybdopterin-guanine dinucleotide biosynthesis protein A